jgi:hypothetical protein
VTEADRVLAALAAALAPAAAPALLARLAAPGAPGAAGLARRLAGRGRGERLAALASALAAAAEAVPPGGATGERPRVAALLVALRAGAAPTCRSPALVRLCRERLEGP